MQGGSLHPIAMWQPPELMKIICCYAAVNDHVAAHNCAHVEKLNNLKCIMACGHCHGIDIYLCITVSAGARVCDWPLPCIVCVC